MDKATEYAIKRLAEIDEAAAKDPHVSLDFEAFWQGELIRAYKQGFADATKKETPKEEN